MNDRDFRRRWPYDRRAYCQHCKAHTPFHRRPWHRWRCVWCGRKYGS